MKGDINRLNYLLDYARMLTILGIAGTERLSKACDAIEEAIGMARIEEKENRCWVIPQAICEDRDTCFEKHLKDLRLREAAPCKTGNER